jgi:hypothetical protein
VNTEHRSARPVGRGCWTKCRAQETELDSVDRQCVHSPLVLFSFDMSKSQKGTRMLARERNATTPPVSLLLPRIGRFNVRLTDNDSRSQTVVAYLSLDQYPLTALDRRGFPTRRPQVKFQGRTSLRRPCTPSTKVHIACTPSHQILCFYTITRTHGKFIYI